MRTLQPATAQSAVSYSATWDGTGDGGASLPAGSYSLVVSATTSVGTVQGSKALQLAAPALTDVEVSPAAFYLGTGSSTLTYTLAGPAVVSVEVMDGNSSTLRTLRQATSLDAGSYSSTWDGTGADGSALAPGSCSLVVSATTSSGTEQSVKAVQVLAPC